MPETKRPYVPVVTDLDADGRIGLTAQSRLGDGIRVRLTVEEAMALRNDLMHLCIDAEIVRVTEARGSS